VFPDPILAQPCLLHHKKEKKKKQNKQNNFQGVLENWFVGDDEGITAYIHEMSRKQISIPKVLEFSWLKTENLAETRSALKHQRLKQLLEMTSNIYHDLVKVFYINLTLDGKNLVSQRAGLTKRNVKPQISTMKMEMMLLLWKMILFKPQNSHAM